MAEKCTTESQIETKCLKDQDCEYFTQIHGYEYSLGGMEHFDTYPHSMMTCRYGRECHAFQRLIADGYRLDDRCHCAVYIHPYRRDNAHIEKTLGSTKFLSAPLRLESREQPAKSLTLVEYTLEDLITELTDNGFKYVMEAKARVSLCDIAKEKMDHPRHAHMGKPLTLVEILSILIYTGTDAYKELRRDEMLFWRGPLKEYPEVVKDYYRDEKNRKWPVLSYILSEAIRKLQKSDGRKRPTCTYHGLNSVELDTDKFDALEVCKLDQSSIKLHRQFMYGTFVSTSTERERAIEFMKSEDGVKGCLMEMEVNQFCIGADVSWISKFSYEREFLIDKCQPFRVKYVRIDAKEEYQIAEIERIGRDPDLLTSRNEYK